VSSIRGRHRTLLLQRSGDRCAFASCDAPLSLDPTDADGPVILGEAAHIEGERPGSARYNPRQSEAQRNAYANLIYVCQAHHKEIDDRRRKYTVTLLKRMKTEHEKRVRAHLSAVRPHAWYLPMNANPQFVGRRSLLRMIDRLGISGTTVIVLHGGPGVGKTELALQWAHQAADRGSYQVVWWIAGETESTRLSSFRHLSKEMNLPESQARDADRMRSGVRKWLESHRNWLLIFDNVAMAAELSSYLPRRSTGHVIITSQSGAWGRIGSTILVDVFSLSESTEFLLRRTRQRDPDMANEIARELGFLPLALEQAAALIDETGMSMGEYLRELRHDRSSLWTMKSPERYPRNVAETIDLAIRRAEKACPEAIALLSLFAHLAPDNIPIAQLRPWLVAPLREQAPGMTRLALRELRSFSLLRSDPRGNTYNVHRLTQRVIRDRLRAVGRRKWASYTVTLLNRALPFVRNDPTTWPDSERLVPHIAIATQHAVEQRVNLAQAADLLSRTGRFVRVVLADYTTARSMLEEALRVARLLKGSTAELLVSSVTHNLGGVLEDEADLSGAATCYRQALTIRQRVLGASHAEVATSASNLGDVYRRLKRLIEAKQLLEFALRIDRAHGGNEDNVSVRLELLGRTNAELGDHDLARKQIHEALTIDERRFGKNHYKIGIRCRALGEVYHMIGVDDEALLLYHRALTIDAKTYSGAHPSIAKDHMLIGQSLIALSRYDLARTHLEAAHNQLVRLVGPEHVDMKDVEAMLSGARPHGMQ